MHWMSHCLLEQMVTSAIRGQNILDFFFTTNPSIVDNKSVTPDLSLTMKSYWLAKVNVKPEAAKQVSRNVLLSKKAGTSSNSP